MSRVAERFDAERLRQARQLFNNISRRQLADLVGCGERQIAAYENGQSPEPKRLVQLAAALNVEPHQLIGKAPYALGELRRAAGMTAEEAAIKLKMSRTTYRQLERDGVWNRSERPLLAAIAELFEAPRRWIVFALDHNEATLKRRAAATVVLAELAELAASPEGDVELRRGDARLSAVARGMDYPVDIIRPHLIAALRRIREAAEADIGAAAVNRWRGHDISDEERREYRTLQQRKYSLPVQLSRDLSSGLLPRAEWSALIKVLSLRGGMFPEQLLAEGVQESLLRKEFIQPALASVSSEGEDSSTNWYTFTAAAVSYWQRNRYRHHNMHPDINSNVSLTVRDNHAWRAAQEAAPRSGSLRLGSGAVIGPTYAE